mmetsp:Transcript_9505/g.15554  ORF Transcript_9505/g.15554 Transcript_9505/m.15554 type:complete len:273 (-) Transcript_9505:117-935(-)
MRVEFGINTVTGFPSSTRVRVVYRRSTAVTCPRSPSTCTVFPIWKGCTAIMSTPARRLEIKSFVAKPKAKPVSPRPVTSAETSMPRVPIIETIPKNRMPTSATELIRGSRRLRPTLVGVHIFLTNVSAIRCPMRVTKNIAMEMRIFGKYTATCLLISAKNGFTIVSPPSTNVAPAITDAVKMPARSLRERLTPPVLSGVAAAASAMMLGSWTIRNDSGQLENCRRRGEYFHSLLHGTNEVACRARKNVACRAPNARSLVDKRDTELSQHTFD